MKEWLGVVGPAFVLSKKKMVNEPDLFEPPLDPLLEKEGKIGFQNSSITVSVKKFPLYSRSNVPMGPGNTTGLS